MNEHDSERMAGLLVANGYEAVERLEDADVVVVNTCCIRDNADRKLYGLLGHLKAMRGQRKDLQVAVGGCLAQKDRAAIVERSGCVDVVFGTQNVSRLPGLLEDALQSSSPIVEVPELAGGVEALESGSFLLPAARRSSWSAWVTIQTGCDNSCAFCIVPSVRGPEVSRPFEEVVDEVRALAARGVLEVTLLGQNVNSYGRDLTLAARNADPGDPSVRRRVGERWAVEATAAGRGRVRPLFADLLRAVGEVDGIERVRFTSPHPKDLRPETIQAMAETRAVCEQLHFPLQSGSDEILSRMHRGYRAKTWQERLEAARRAVDDLAVTTDVIVGFPGETEDDFERTLEVVADAGLDGAYTFVFSPRPGTEAARAVEAFVPEEVTRERFERLKAVVDRSAAERHRARIGRVEEVVVEGSNRRFADQLDGRTRQGKLVHFAPDGPGVPPGALEPGVRVPVRVVGAGAHHLEAEVLGPLRAAPHGRGAALGRRRSISVPLRAEAR
jgi:tRNA-2-methylthio-N6-dimethylallyladenosine synthase